MLYGGGPKEASPLHADIIKDNGGRLEGTTFSKVRDSVPNMEHNADSYAILGSLCARSLYKRALTQEDPVRILCNGSKYVAYWCIYKGRILSCQTSTMRALTRREDGETAKGWNEAGCCRSCSTRRWYPRSQRVSS